MAVETTVTEHRSIWSAIISGAFISLAVFLVSIIFSNNLGLSAFTPQARIPLDLAASTAMYLLAGILISFFIGGFATGRLSGPHRSLNAALLGLTTWAVIAVLSAVVIGYGSAISVGPIAMSPVKTSQTAVVAKAERGHKGRTKAIETTKETTPPVTAKSDWTVFFGLVIGALASIFGGIIGNPGKLSGRELGRVHQERRMA